MDLLSSVASSVNKKMTKSQKFMTSKQGGLTDLQLLRHRNVAYERLFNHKKLSEANGNHWLTKKYELHLQTQLHLSSKNFRPQLKTMKLSGVYFEQQSLHPPLTAVNVSVLERRGVARKEPLGGTRRLKKLFVQKKWPIRPDLQTHWSSLELRSQYSEARKASATKVKLSKERAWKGFGERLDHGSSTGGNCNNF